MSARRKAQRRQVRARLIHAAGAKREATKPEDVGVVWYDTLDAIHAAFTEGWADGDDVQWGGETPDGEEVTFTAEQMLAGMRSQGMWGFEKGGTIHLWADADKVGTAEFAHLVAHEVSHAVCAHDGTLEDEHEAERYGAVTAQTVRIVGIIRGLSVESVRAPLTQNEDER